MRHLLANIINNKKGQDAVSEPSSQLGYLIVIIAFFLFLAFIIYEAVRNILK